jgi:hypothetical protein
VAALPVTLLNNRPTRINWRRHDNLPSHVLRNAFFTVLVPTERGYVVDLIDDETKETRRYAVEFLKVDGDDNWYLLEQQNGHWYTGPQNCVDILNNYGLGWWRITDPEHPDWKAPATTSTEEEILSGGLHHIVTTQGTQPLTQEQPPTVLQEIVRTASQGQEIPTNIPPVMAHIQEEQANITITAPAPSPRNGEGGNLLGTPPPVFMGDRTKAQAFLDAIAVWRAVNYKKEVMRDPYTRTALILTFIKGDNVNSWAKHQLKILNQNQENNPDPTGKPDEDWWDTFEQNFKNAFTFTASKETALAKLEKLAMTQGDLDTYIATFNRLLDKAEFLPRDKGAIEMFKRGLTIGLKINCIKRKPKPETMEEWQEAARQEHLDYLEVQQALGKNPYNIKDNVLHTLCKKQGSGGGNSKMQYWKAKGPDAMEVDNTLSKEPKDEISEGGPRKKLTDKEKAALRLLGLCYFCRGKDHLSKNCPKKPPFQGWDKKTSSGRAPTRPPPNKWNKPRVRSAETEGEQILLTREYVQKNFQDMVLLLDENERAEALGKAAQQLPDF